jgi:hypothetical protein
MTKQPSVTKGTIYRRLRFPTALCIPQLNDLLHFSEFVIWVKGNVVLHSVISLKSIYLGFAESMQLIFEMKEIEVIGILRSTEFTPGIRRRDGDEVELLGEG